MKFKIVEIFKSLQGEGLYQKKSQIFVRLAGCNLQCSYCDTKFERYHSMSIEQILEEITKHMKFHSVAITGGEPLCQAAAVRTLAQCLKKRGIIVYLETNGTLPKKLAKVIHWIDIVAMDFKLPSSTGQKSFWRAHRDFLRIAAKKEVFIKAIVGLRTIKSDIDKVIESIKRINIDIPLVLQMQHPYEKQLLPVMKDYKKFCADSGIKTTIGFQLHKKLGIR